MNLSDRHTNNRMVVIDLADGSIIHSNLTANMLEHIGGAAINTLLIEKYIQHCPLVLGTGPLTGGFAPASCLMAASFYSKDNGFRHVPVVVKSGPLLKLSGLDFVVFLGQAPEPSVVIIEKGSIRVNPADDLAGLSIPKAINQLQQKTGTEREIALVTGPNTTGSSSHHSASTSIFGGFDRCGLARHMASKNIRAIVLGGGGKISFSTEDLEANRLLTAKVQKQLPRYRPHTILGKMMTCDPAKTIVKKYFRHSHACFHCPVACINFLQYPSKQMKIQNKNDPVRGVFILDHEGFAAFSRKRPKDAHILMEKSMALGLNPVISAEQIDPRIPPGRCIGTDGKTG